MRKRIREFQFFYTMCRTLRGHSEFLKSEFFQAYIKEDSISVRITITFIDAIKSLWELNITNSFPCLWIHQETHSLSHSFAIVYIMVTVQVQDERGICKNPRDANLEISRNQSYLTTLCKTKLKSCRILS